MYILIMIVFLIGNKGSAGYGGVSTNTHEFATFEECVTAKEAFLELSESKKELGKDSWGKKVDVVSSAKCVKVR